MRRAATAAFATTLLAVSFGAPSFAGASLAESPPVTDRCSLAAPYPVVSDPFCTLVTPLDSALAPVTDEATATPVPAAPAPAPTPESEAAPAPAPTPSSSSGPMQASSSSTPAPASLGGSLSAPGSSQSTTRQSAGRVPDVPVGSTLELGPLALPRFSGPVAAATASGATADAVAERMVLPAARAAAALPTQSRTTAVTIALGTLLLAAGLLLEQARRARQLIQI